jgi:integrase
LLQTFSEKKEGLHMSYWITVRKNKWYVTHRRYEDGAKIDKRIPTQSLTTIGFSSSMTIDEAKVRAASLNAQTAYNKAEEKKKIRSISRVQKTERIKSAFLPEADCEQFESQTLFKRFARRDLNSQRYKKALSHWAYVQKMIASVAMDPSDWSEKATSFYEYFQDQKTSPEYVSKLIRILNYWGHFTAKKHAKSFLPVAMPRGEDKQLIADIYYNSEGEGGPADPLNMPMLEKAQPQFTVPGHFEWLYISVAFGLRPSELDSLKIPGTWAIYWDSKNEVDVLKVYQPKLSSVSEQNRWKHIPIIYEEQKKARVLIDNGIFKRPLTKTLRKIFPVRITPYYGRKGFTDWMLDRGQDLQDIASFLGHQSLETTIRFYKQRNIVRF